MKSFLHIFKFVLLAALLVAMYFGYTFFRIWQKNERPVVTESSWSVNEVLIGHATTLEMTVTAPWHREIDSTRAITHPSYLAPVPDEGKIEKGTLDFSGQRTWKITVPFVPTDIKVKEGGTASFPVKSTKRISPNSFNLTLPALTVTTPELESIEPKNPGLFLTGDEPEEELISGENEEKKSYWWAWLLAALALVGLVLLLLRKSGIIRTTPPWEKALGNLDALSPDTEPKIFFSKLTDILKQYTAERYTFRARSKTSAEFIGTMKNHPLIPNDHLDELSDLAHLADEVKFADGIPREGRAAASLDLVRVFIKATTPQESPSDQSDV